MLIVPEADALVVEVRADPQKIDQIKLGQPAALRFPNFSQRTTPELNGRVSRIAADVIQDQRSVSPIFSYASVCHWTSLPALNGLKLVPGMPVEAEIQLQ